MAVQDVIAIANDVFGPTGWSSDCSLVETVVETDNEGRFVVFSRVKVDVKVGSNCHSAVGYDTQKSKNQQDATTNAEKSARSDGLKGALKMYGNVLGLFLGNQEVVKSALNGTIDSHLIYTKNMFSSSQANGPDVSRNANSKRLPGDTKDSSFVNKNKSSSAKLVGSKDLPFFMDDEMIDDNDF